MSDDRPWRKDNKLLEKRALEAQIDNSIITPFRIHK